MDLLSPLILRVKSADIFLEPQNLRMAGILHALLFNHIETV
jgi:hypothetical protein